MPYRFSHHTVFTDAPEVQGTARTLMRRVGALLFLVGGITIVLTLATPAVRARPTIVALPVAAICFGLAAYLGFRRQVPDWVLLATPPLGTLTVTAIMSIEGTASGTPFFYLWPMLVAAYFMQRRELVLNYLLVCVSLAVALALWVEVPDGRVVMFMDTAMAVGMVSVLVFALKTNVSQLLAGMHKASTTDPLTGALNRGAFQEKLGQAVAGPTPAVLALLDIDHFKSVNDRWGHPAGDAALRRFCEIVQSVMGEDDVLGRLGGEEFGLLLRGTDSPDAYAFADRLRERVQRETASEEVHLTVSVGLAVHAGETTSDDLFKAADVALYMAKDGGRNRVAVADRRTTSTQAG